MAKIIHKPIIVGTHAIYLGKKASHSDTHKWACYLRSPQPMHYISKVEFLLDESFEPSLIALSEPPFEIHQTGWGQFTIGLRIYFHDESVQYVELAKELVLFDDMPQSTKRPVIREDYDELVFVDPSPSFTQLLN